MVVQLRHGVGLQPVGLTLANTDSNRIQWFVDGDSDWTTGREQRGTAQGFAFRRSIDLIHI